MTHEPATRVSPSVGAACPASPTRDRRRGWLAVGACLGVAALLAAGPLFTDSMTFDEAAHLTAGMSYLRTGDFRLVPETPPLAQVWAALPLLATDARWPGSDTPGWANADIVRVERTWLFRLNDGERLLPLARSMILLTLLAVDLCIWASARRLFGPRAGMLALILAALCPTLLAHGHLVTADVPAALCFMLVLLTFTRYLERASALRLAALTGAATALCLVKFSWPLVLPALLLMAAIAVARTEPWSCPLVRTVGGRFDRSAAPALVRRSHRVLALGATVLVVGAGCWVGIWTCFGWRYAPFRGPDQARAMLPVLVDADGPPPATVAAAWESVLEGRDGQPRRGLTTTFIRSARTWRVLPEAYLYGAAWTIKFSDWWNPKYFQGEIRTRGWLAYFPLAFGLKTPLPTMPLCVAGLGAPLCRATPGRRSPALLVGLAGFSVVYVTVAIASRFNIGHRHLLPIYPPLLVLAGAAVGWWRYAAGRGLVLACAAWLLVGNLGTHPHYLSYFNELIGGPANGHLYLADSNLDWGQDLKRLAAYARRHPTEPIKLAYFGSADPTKYGFPCEALPSFLPFGEPAKLTAGTYVVSATQLLGVYSPLSTDDFWKRKGLEEYRSLSGSLSDTGPPDLRRHAPPALARMQRRYEVLRAARLINQLRRRQPDERIGCSLFVYRLTTTDVDELLRP